MNLPDLFDSAAEIPPDAPPVSVLGNRVVTLHVSGDALDPDQVSNLFRVSPTESERRGLPQVRSDGSVEQRVASAGRWSLGVGDAGDEGVNINEAIEALLALLPEDAQTWKAVANLGTLHLAVNWTVNPGNSEIWLEPRLLAFLGERAVGLYVEVYQRDPDLDAPQYI
jgi:hypothetical protein